MINPASLHQLLNASPPLKTALTKIHTLADSNFYLCSLAASVCSLFVACASTLEALKISLQFVGSVVVLKPQVSDVSNASRYLQLSTYLVLAAVGGVFLPSQAFKLLPQPEAATPPPEPNQNLIANLAIHADLDTKVKEQKETLKNLKTVIEKETFEIRHNIAGETTTPDKLQSVVNALKETVASFTKICTEEMNACAEKMRDSKKKELDTTIQSSYKSIIKELEKVQLA